MYGLLCLRSYYFELPYFQDDSDLHAATWQHCRIFQRFQLWLSRDGTRRNLEKHIHRLAFLSNCMKLKKVQLKTPSIDLLVLKN